MSNWLIALCGFIYLGVSIDLYIHDKVGLSIAYFGYAFANIGLYMAASNG